MCGRRMRLFTWWVGDPQAWGRGGDPGAGGCRRDPEGVTQEPGTAGERCKDGDGGVIRQGFLATWIEHFNQHDSLAVNLKRGEIPILSCVLSLKKNKSILRLGSCKDKEIRDNKRY